MNRGGLEREGDTESETGSRLWAFSTEPVVGLEPTKRKIMTWAEVGTLNWLSHPGAPEHMTLDLRVMSSNPTSGIEITYKKEFSSSVLLAKFQVFSSHIRLLATISTAQMCNSSIIMESSRSIYRETNLSLAGTTAFPKITQMYCARRLPSHWGWGKEEIKKKQNERKNIQP